MAGVAHVVTEEEAEEGDADGLASRLKAQMLQVWGPPPSLYFLGDSVWEPGRGWPLAGRKGSPASLQ